VLPVHIAALTTGIESQRCGNAGQNRRWKQPAQFMEKTCLADGRQQLRHEFGYGAKPSADSLHAAAKPPDRARQCHLWPAHQIGGGLQAASRLHCRDTSLDRVEQARQPRGHKVG
jgi:hypothetical protein